MEILNYNNLKFVAPAGYTNASDAFIRDFVCELKEGFMIKKEASSKFKLQKAKQNILLLHADGISLTWVKPKRSHRPPDRLPRLDLRDCTEVRFPLRESGQSSLACELVFPQRCLKIMSASPEECEYLAKGFSSLCYNLQLAKLLINEKEETHDDESTHRSLSFLRSDDNSVCSFSSFQSDDAVPSFVSFDSDMSEETMKINEDCDDDDKDTNQSSSSCPKFCGVADSLRGLFVEG